MPSDSETSQPPADQAGKNPAPSSSTQGETILAGGTAPEPEPRTIDTSGGDYAERDIDKRQGTFIGYVDGPVIIEEAERAYDVRGLPNPYLGLSSGMNLKRSSHDQQLRESVGGLRSKE